MKTFAIRAVALPPRRRDWREQLAQMLGAKPRRIGIWSELGLYGALNCMVDAGEKTLSPEAQIWLGSRLGNLCGYRHCPRQLREDLPMPVAFLQTQPSQLLALLAARMDWKGHACFVAGAEPGRYCVWLPRRQARAVLLGWLDEMDGGMSSWLRLLPCEGDWWL